MMMRRVKEIFLILWLMLLFLLCACGKSEAATNADTLILAIGEVSLESESAIVAAEEAVSALSEKDRNHIEYLHLLTSAREEYNQSRVNHVKTLVSDACLSYELNEAGSNAYGATESRLQQNINEARQAYEALPLELQVQISNYSSLADIENELAVKKAQLIERLISSIGEVSSSSKDTIKTARTMYEKYDDTIQNLVSNYR